MTTDKEHSEIRYIGDLQRLSPLSGDVFVITSDNLLHQGQRIAIMDAWKIALPDTKLMILDGGLKLGVIGVTDETT